MHTKRVNPLKDNLQILGGVLVGGVIGLSLYLLTPFKKTSAQILWMCIGVPVVAIIVGLLLALLNAYTKTRWLGYKLTNNERTYVERMVSADARLRIALKELIAANEDWDQPNLKRAINQTKKSQEVWNRKMLRLGRETRQRSKNQKSAIQRTLK